MRGARTVTMERYLRYKDPHRRAALVVQGGGMRGVYSMGALAALEDHGLRECFHLVIGSSAGAINGMYLLSGQAHEAVDVYLKHLSNRRFVNPLRIRKVVDIDYLVDHALKQFLPIDVAVLRTSRSDLHVVLTDATSAEARVIRVRDVSIDTDLYEVMRATTALPGLYDRSVPVGASRYVDGGTVDALPVVRAAEWGAQDILAVLTRPGGYRDSARGPLYRMAATLVARGQSPAVRAQLAGQDLLFNRAMDLLEGRAQVAGLRCWGVAPSDPGRLVQRTTVNSAGLRRCAEMGRRDMELALAADVAIIPARSAT
jgi:predicted patatin/cPLA2 family phospholipase